MGHIFISYSHQDKVYVHKLQETLRNEGFDAWIDDRIDYGEEWLKVIEEHLDGCDAFILVMSNNSRKSEMVQNEVTRAREKKKNIFPVMLDGENWLIVQAKQFVDVRDGSLPPEKFYERLEAVASRNKVKRRSIEKVEPKSEKFIPSGKPVARKQDKFLSEKLQPEKTKPTRKSNILIIVVMISFVSVVVVVGLSGSSLSEKWFEIVSSLANSTSGPVVFDPHPSSSDYIDVSGISMRLISAGEFAMGSDNNNVPYEQPVHHVYLDAYYIDKYEITNAMYNVCVGKGICREPVYHWFDNDLRYSQNPVVYITWIMAKTYCEWRGARLPTEAEWEKAARGKDEFIYPWGNDFDALLSNFCDTNCSNYVDRSKNDGYGKTSPVGTYPNGASPYGVFDMAGNAYEWVADWFDTNYYANSPSSNPLGPSNGQFRVLRGGSFGSSDIYVRTTSRWSAKENAVNEYWGFRCAKDANP
jgi:formylglycine-generating enzyme required for sulfatase activity